MGEAGERLQRDRMKHFGGRELLYVLIVLGITRLYAFVKIYGTVHLKGECYCM